MGPVRINSRNYLDLTKSQLNVPYNLTKSILRTVDVTKTAVWVVNSEDQDHVSRSASYILRK